MTRRTKTSRQRAALHHSEQVSKAVRRICRTVGKCGRITRKQASRLATLGAPPCKRAPLLTVEIVTDRQRAAQVIAEAKAQGLRFREQQHIMHQRPPKAEVREESSEHTETDRPTLGARIFTALLGFLAGDSNSSKPK